MRMRLLVALFVVLAASVPAAAGVQLQAELTASAPLFLTHANDSRLFVVEQAGTIRVHVPGSGAPPAVFLDITSKVRSGGERGLLSMAFHPDFAQNGFFYVNYTNLSGATTIERYQVSSDPNAALPGSGIVLMQIAQPFSNHNGGQLQVGPDGLLYIGMGDGGSANDPACLAQDTSSYLGKMLRIDIRQNLNQAPFYGIPAGNPFVGSADPGNAVPDETWALGLRNPWRFSFDRSTGELYIADVGQNQWEEINRVSPGTAAGANFGWKIKEGASCFVNDAQTLG